MFRAFTLFRVKSSHSHAFAAASEPRKSFVTFSIPKSERIELQLEVNYLFQPKISKHPNGTSWRQRVSHSLFLI